MSLMDEMLDAAGGKDAVSEQLRPLLGPLDVMNAFNARFFISASRQGPKGEPISELHMGIPQGKQTLIVGYTGAGKSTLAIQIGCSQVEPYEEAGIFHFDQEQALSPDRVMDITGWPLDKVNAKYKNMKPVTNEGLYEFILKVAKIKMENRRKYTVEGPDGPQLVPSVIIVDTLATMMTNDISGKDGIGSMMAEPGTIAKFNNAIYQRLPRTLADANITLITVNHIRDKISEGGAPSRKRVFSMGADEAIPGGHGHMQMADFFIKVVGDGAPLKEDDQYKIPGKVILCKVIKSRLAREGTEFKLVYDPRVGFSNFLTNLHFLREKKHLSGAGAHQFLTLEDGTTSRKFALSQAMDFYHSDGAFREIFDQKVNEALSAVLPQEGENFQAAGASLSSAEDLAVAAGIIDVALADAAPASASQSVAAPARRPRAPK